MDAMGLWPIKEYIWRRQATIAEHIVNCPIYELCTATEKMLGSSIFMRWWYQEINPEEEGDGASKGVDIEVW